MQINLQPTFWLLWITPILLSGFIPGGSTDDQLVDVYNTVCKSLDEGKEVHAIFSDTSKMFDRVWNEGFIFNLKLVGVSGLSTSFRKLFFAWRFTQKK